MRCVFALPVIRNAINAVSACKISVSIPSTYAVHPSEYGNVNTKYPSVALVSVPVSPLSCSYTFSKCAAVCSLLSEVCLSATGAAYNDTSSKSTRFAPSEIHIENSNVFVPLSTTPKFI